MPNFLHAINENGSIYIMSLLKLELFTFSKARKLTYNASNLS